MLDDYMKSPNLLARRLMAVFSGCEKDSDVAIHNDVIKDIQMLCSDKIPILLNKTAALIIDIGVAAQLQRKEKEKTRR